MTHRMLKRNLSLEEYKRSGMLKNIGAKKIPMLKMKKAIASKSI